ncbi:MAG: glutaredoxin [Oscillospiraceae bacterium]|nr:glutaredoxin [Oscillospiraceae bacterium]
MVKVYGSPMCPDCVRCKKNLDANNLEYEFIDVNQSLRDLKQFLIYRDTLPIFDHCKEIHDIGLPALVLEDGTVTLRWSDYIRSQGGTPLADLEQGAACSLDGTGC